MQIQWRASVSASALHAAQCLNEGLRPADARLAAAIAAPTELLAGELAAANVPPGAGLATLEALAASGIDNNRQLATQALTRLAGRAKVGEPLVSRVAGRLADLEAAFLRFDGRTADDLSVALVDELLLRGRVLAEQWEARGPGLFRELARLTEEGVLAERAEVVLVYPALGGHGRAHRPVNAVSFEAVLANADPAVPEVLRLAWLLAQLNLDLPRYAEHVSPGRLQQVGRYALVPAVLAAAEYVELARFDEATVEWANNTWRVEAAARSDKPGAAAPGAAVEGEPVAQRLLTWWRTYQEYPTPWAVALAALERMLPSADGRPASGDRP